MWDDPESKGRWRTRRLSLIHVLGVGLALSLALSVYLLSRADVRALALSPVHGPTLAPTATAVPSVQHSNRGEAPSDFETPTPQDLDTMMAQLQEMQNGLITLSNQLEQKVVTTRLLPPATVMPYQTTGLGAQAATGGAVDVSAALAEIDQLYQVMQPLMVQMQAASQANRPASEQDAIRSQMAAIHERLSYLLSYVEAARQSGTSPAVSTGAPAATGVQSQDQANYQQLLQALGDLQSTLDQLQGQPGAATQQPPSANWQSGVPGPGLMGGMGGH